MAASSSRDEPIPNTSRGGRNKPDEPIASTSRDTGEPDGCQPLSYLNSEKTTYRVLDNLGSGSFGSVYKCLDLSSNEEVAVKMSIKSRVRPKTVGRLWTKAKEEYKNCHLFKGSPNIVQVFDVFLHSSVPCIVFECLHESLFEYIVKRGPLPMKEVRLLAVQLFRALGALKEMKIIHGDLKPENVMLKFNNSGIQLKVIDFGSSMAVSACSIWMIFQTLHFRAPEVIIFAPRSVKVDMWSAGCIVAEMLAGRRLYPGNSPQEQLYMIEKCQGPLSEYTLSKSKNISEFYERLPDSTLKMKFQPAVNTKVKKMSCDPYFTFKTESLRDLVAFDTSANIGEMLRMLNLCEYMLSIDEEFRCSPEEALQHIFSGLI